MEKKKAKWKKKTSKHWGGNLETNFMIPGYVNVIKQNLKNNN